MAELDDKVIVTKSKITDIADALREEMSESYEYSLPTMVEKVHELGQGQGSEYTAGVGIDITNRVVSVVDTLMIRGSANGSIASFDDGADDIPLKSCIVSIEPVQSGSGDPSPSNVRPITGWTECNITKISKNFFDKTTYTNKRFLSSNGNINTSDNWSISDYIGIKGNTSYILSGVTNAGNVACHCFYDKSKNFISSVVSTTQNFTTPVDAYYVRLSMRTETPDSVQFELGSTATEFAPYVAPTIYNIEFPLEAGTVYGGTLDVTNGVLTVTDGYIASYNSETLPSTWISSMDVYAEGTTPTTGAEVVYKLATPQTYNVTPTEIKTLLGINNIFADCGDVDVEYTRDATLIINKLLELVSGNNRTMMKSAVVEKTDEVKEQKKDSVEENLDA